MAATLLPTPQSYPHRVFRYSLSIIPKYGEINIDVPIVILKGTQEEIKEHLCSNVDRLFRAARLKKV
jgi:hypothetical protein